MARLIQNRIFARCGVDEFVGRDAELRSLIDLAGNSDGLALLAAPLCGATELLRQVYDRLFFSQSEVIPFYFEVRMSDGDASGAATRFLREFLLQTVAFRRRDPRIIDASPEICEIAELAVPADGLWIDRLVESCQSDSKLNDDQAFIRNCLSSPLRAASAGVRTFVLLDNMHIVREIDAGESFFEMVNEIFSRGQLPFAVAGHRRFLYGSTQLRTLNLEPLSFTDAGSLIERLAAKKGVLINDQARDLIAVKLIGRPAYYRALFAATAASGNGLNTFELVEQAYTDEIFGGRIGRSFEETLDRTLPNRADQAVMMRLFAENLASAFSKTSVTYWQKRSGFSNSKLDGVLTTLNACEVINVDSGSVQINPDNTVFADYASGRIRQEINGEARALVVGETLSDNIRRAPQLMARHYRRNTSLGLRDLLNAFDGRQISPALIDYGRFRDEFKGAEDEKILKALQEDNLRMSLPQIVFTAATSAFYPKFDELSDAERSAVAIGFTDTGKKDQIAWITVEIDSKLEATREVTEFWCDRLEMAALNCNFEHYKIWLIAREGFDDEAQTTLKSRNAYGSSRKQAELLTTVLGASLNPEISNFPDVYELTVPMGDETEMIAVHAAEEIARRHNFPAKAINQIKTALVEACINAAEHSLSPDRKTHIKFAFDGSKLTITVSNRGVRLTDKKVGTDVKDETRRGWGLKLIEGLMDEVKVAQTDDGTQITMSKDLVIE